MDRRKSIKSIILGAAATGLVVNGCKPEGERIEEERAQADELHFGRTAEEKEHIAKLEAEQFLSEHELLTIGVLADLILPANETSPSASATGVPSFIEFMAKDMPEMQTLLRGGLMWLDHESNSKHGTIFATLQEVQQKEIIDAMAYPEPDIWDHEQRLEVQFFSLMRNLTITGYYTSKEGIADLGYKGNVPNLWDGVPEDVLQQHGVAYEEEWLAKCIDHSKRETIAEWDDNGNLLT